VSIIIGLGAILATWSPWIGYPVIVGALGSGVVTS